MPTQQIRPIDHHLRQPDRRRERAASDRATQRLGGINGSNISIVINGDTYGGKIDVRQDLPRQCGLVVVNAPQVQCGGYEVPRRIRCPGSAR